MTRRPLLERALDLPEKLILRARLSPNARILWLGLVRFLQQIVRSRARRHG
jgi:hypothetical protein